MSRRGGAPPPPRPGGRPRRANSRGRDDVRTTAAWVVERTLDSRGPVDSFLASAQDRFEDRDRALLNELVLGTLRWLRRIDDVLARASHRPLAEVEPVLHGPLRVAAYQLLFLDRVPAHAAVHEAVEQAQALTHRGAASFVNAVLRRIARQRRLVDWPVEEPDAVRRLAIEMSHPDFLVRRWVERYGWQRTRRLLAANNRPKPLHLLAFRDRGGRELLAEGLIDDGVEVEPSPLSLLGLVVRAGDPFASAAFRRGDFYVQDEASQAAALVPPPSPGERVLDAAAAPGGKAFAMLAWEPSIRAVASDLDAARVAVLGANLRRLRRRVAVAVADAGRLPFREGFDRVVVDLPCTGTGTLRKHPELKWRVSEDELGRLAAQGERLLAGGAEAVAPGGLLVAITCSLEPEENEAVAARFLAGRDDFAPLDLDGLLPPPLAPSVAGPGRWQVLPDGDHDGFTVSVLSRRAGRAKTRAAAGDSSSGPC
ncbi:MAG TPA: transcription antitermination factor NusB [Thermoanaerobaculia bacterium]|nr:transcription antitermination factor NusB [Thermoanaerobaculia bacterium]